jgi:hypothetical protein
VAVWGGPVSGDVSGSRPASAKLAEMSAWGEIESAEPALAARARACFTATRNAVLGTVRRDGSPRLSGIDPFLFDGEMWIGSMGRARKGADLRRDPRMALHCVPWESRLVAEGEPAPAGDAKLTGRAQLVSDRATIQRVTGHTNETTGFEAPDDSDFFRIDVQELVLISVEDDQLVIDRWTADGGREVTRRA